MRTLYIEGLAIHGDPESCAVAREGGGEVLIGVRAGSAIEPRNQGLRGADAVRRGGRQDRRSCYREWPADPARSKNGCMHGVSRRENREVPRSPVPVGCDWVAGREGNAGGGTPSVHDRGKSEKAPG